MFGWFSSRKRKEEQAFVETMMKAHLLKRNLLMLRMAISTISNETLEDADPTVNAARTSSILTLSLIEDAKAKMDNDDDRFVGGLLTFVFADHFSHKLGGKFELASAVAVAYVVGMEQMDRCIGPIVDNHNAMAMSKDLMLDAIGTKCANWCADPTPENYKELAELYLFLKQHVEPK
jgi:hypothetical protein